MPCGTVHRIRPHWQHDFLSSNFALPTGSLLCHFQECTNILNGIPWSHSHGVVLRVAALVEPGGTERGRTEELRPWHARDRLGSTEARQMYLRLLTPRSVILCVLTPEIGNSGLLRQPDAAEQILEARIRAEGIEGRFDLQGTHYIRMRATGLLKRTHGRLLIANAKESVGEERRINLFFPRQPL